MSWRALQCQVLAFSFVACFLLGMDQLSCSNSISTEGIISDQAAPLCLWWNSQSFGTSGGPFLPQLEFWHQCSPTQQLMTSLGLPHPFSNASPPNPPPLPAVPACNPDLISSYLSHHSKTSCLNLRLGSFLWNPSHSMDSPLLSELLPWTSVPSPRLSGGRGLPKEEGGSDPWGCP